MKRSDKRLLPEIKFYPPPSGCSDCWRKRKQIYKAMLPEIKFNDDYTLVVKVIGTASKDDVLKLEKFLKAELMKLKLGYIHIEIKNWVG